MSRPRDRYVLEFDSSFESGALDETQWLPYYLPHWSSREQARARYEVARGRLRLLIEAGQKPWCPEFDGEVRVSSLQTAAIDGQHRFNDSAVVRERHEPVALYTPQYGLFEIRAKALADPRAMVALWLIGYEDTAEHSGELCVCEIFGRDLQDGEAGVGMGVHPFGDPALSDDFEKVLAPIDARDFHLYAADWTPDGVAFYIDDELVKRTRQSPGYPLQLMLSAYEFEPGGEYPKVFEVDYVRGYRPNPVSGR